MSKKVPSSVMAVRMAVRKAPTLLEGREFPSEASLNWIGLSRFNTVVVGYGLSSVSRIVFEKPLPKARRHRKAVVRLLARSYRTKAC